MTEHNSKVNHMTELNGRAQIMTEHNSKVNHMTEHYDCQ